MTSRTASRTALAILASCTCLVLAGCGQEGEQARATASQAASQVSTAASNAVDDAKTVTASLKSDAGLEASDTWVRAVPELGAEKMTPRSRSSPSSPTRRPIPNSTRRSPRTARR